MLIRIDNTIINTDHLIRVSRGDTGRLTLTMAEADGAGIIGYQLHFSGTSADDLWSYLVHRSDDPTNHVYCPDATTNSGNQLGALHPAFQDGTLPSQSDVKVVIQ